MVLSFAEPVGIRSHTGPLSKFRDEMSAVCKTAFFCRVQNRDFRDGIRQQESCFSNADIIDIGYRNPVGDPVEETAEILFVHVHDCGEIMQIDFVRVMCLNIDHQLFQGLHPATQDYLYTSEE